MIQIKKIRPNLVDFDAGGGGIFEHLVEPQHREALYELTLNTGESGMHTV